MILKYGLYMIWVLSCLGTLGSLYIGNPSCLDWYQRVCLFPLIFIAGIAAWRGFLAIVPYIIPQALFGLGCAVYQILLLKKVECLTFLYHEPVNQQLVPFIFAGIFLTILVLSLFLSKKQSARIFL